MRKSITLEIENFGPIKSGVVPVGKLTVIVGPSSSGKTYIAKLVYIISKIMKNLSDSIDIKFNYFKRRTIKRIDQREYEYLRKNIYEKIAKLLENRETDTLIENSSYIIERIANIVFKELSNIEEKISYHIKNIIEDTYETDIISLINSTSDKAELTLSFNGLRILKISIYREKIKPIRVTLNKEIIEKSINTLLWKKVIILYDDKLNYIINELYGRDTLFLFDNLRENINEVLRERLSCSEEIKITSVDIIVKNKACRTCIIIAECGDKYFIIFSTNVVDDYTVDLLVDSVLAFYLGYVIRDYYKIIREIVTNLEYSIIVPGLRRSDVLLKIGLEKLESYASYGRVPSINDFEDIKRRTNIPIYLLEYLFMLTLSIVSSIKSRFYEDLREIENLIFCGELDVENRRIVFHDYRCDITTSILSASASVQQLSGIFLIMKYGERRLNCIIIEDPEIHCHAGVQTFLALFLSMLANRGVNVIVTTHSHYIVQRLYSLTMLDNLKKRNPTLYRETVYKIAECWSNYLENLGCKINKDLVKDVLEKAVIGSEHLSFVAIRWNKDMKGFYAQEYTPLDRTMPSLSEVLDILIMEDLIIEKNLTQLDEKEE